MTVFFVTVDSVPRPRHRFHHLCGVLDDEWRGRHYDVLFCFFFFPYPWPYMLCEEAALRVPLACIGEPPRLVPVSTYATVGLVEIQEQTSPID